METDNSSVKGLITWRDLVITPLIEVAIFGISIAISWCLNGLVALGVIENILLVYFLSVIFTLFTLKILRLGFFVHEGVYSIEHDVTPCYVFNLYEFLLLINLGLFYSTSVIPSLLRKEFYQLLGSNIGGGLVIIGGKIEGPHYITIGENVVLGDDAVLYPHVFSNADAKGSRFLTIGNIEIGKNAIIGSRSTIMPGVKVGEGAMVNAMSFVPMNAVIPQGEIWGGIPAVKIGEVPSG